MLRLVMLEATVATQHQRLMMCEAELLAHRTSRAPNEMLRDAQADSERHAPARATPRPSDEGACGCCVRLIERVYLGRDHQAAVEASRRRV